MGNKKAQIIHNRMRLKNCNLNSILYNRNLANDPYCRCGAMEDSKHFLLTCPLYHRQRQKFLGEMNLLGIFRISTKVLLNGDESHNEETDKRLLCKVHDFILGTQRF